MSENILDVARRVLESEDPPRWDDSVQLAEAVERMADRLARLEVFARRIGYSEGFEDGEYLACSDTPHCRKGETHSPDCAVYEARAALNAAESAKRANS